MLSLKGITKNYVSGEEVVHALKGISVDFRKSEFVSILGPSGCGKTTLLNIVGGLDKYTNGDLIINGKSTKAFNDKDWDTYRNHTIGFVFQSYNLIPHQTVLENVELALTLSGVYKKERKERARKALEQVGLHDQIKKKPNQLSGGQMQRVAIARALVNNPDIILADEPTGALDTETSVQIMEILKEISKEKLIIMVTHNPELAETYSNRIIRLVDGRITGDTNPYVDDGSEEYREYNLDKKTSMSFVTALSLSLKNLFTKKARTILTSFAGSIGIVGIALILSVSSGVTNYIDTVERSTMASYPIAIEKNTMDVTSMMSSFIDQETTPAEDGYIESNDFMITLMDAVTNMERTNNISKFKEYVESSESGIKANANDIVYNYSAHLNTYYLDGNEYKKTYSGYNEILTYIYSNGQMEPSGSSSNSLFTQMIGDQKFIESQYALVYGDYPKNNNEVLISVDENNKISDYVLYSLGIRDLQEVIDYNKALSEYESDPENNKKPDLPKPTKYTYKDLCEHSFKVLLDSDLYKIENGLIKERSNSEINDFLKTDAATTLKIVGIVKPSEESQAALSIGSILYYKDMMMGENGFINQVNNSEVVKLQKDNQKTNLFYNRDFDNPYTEDDYNSILGLLVKINGMSYELTPLGLQFFNIYQDTAAIADKAKVVAFANTYMLGTYESCLKSLGYIDFSNPNSIYIYPRDFDAKEAITNAINRYNANATKEDEIIYSDMVGLLLSSVNIIVDAISYVLIAFVSISLVVSSIMIGIITYISVLERTKEIGVLRAVGASKRDISRVFNAETIIIGFAAGAIGIGLTLLLIIPINLILHAVTGISYLSASLPVAGAFILVLISILLTFIAGLIPSSFAAKKDPVIALRTE